MSRIFALAMLAALFCCAGCNCSSSGVDVSAQRSRLLLSEEPPEALGVLDLQESLTSEEQNVVVVGRIGGGQPVFEPHHALFTIVDPSTAPSHHHEDGCEENCPFCSKAAEEHTVAYVHCVDNNGEMLRVAANQLLGIKAGQTVVILGRARADEAGNLIIRAAGVYVRG